MKKLEWVKRPSQPWEQGHTYEAKLGPISYFINVHENIVMYNAAILAARPDFAAKQGIFRFFTASYGPNDKPGLVPLTRLSNDDSTFDECQELCQKHYESILNA